jgi:hypothetical protein
MTLKEIRKELYELLQGYGVFIDEDKRKEIKAILKKYQEAIEANRPAIKTVSSVKSPAIPAVKKENTKPAGWKPYCG